MRKITSLRFCLLHKGQLFLPGESVSVIYIVPILILILIILHSSFRTSLVKIYLMKPSHRLTRIQIWNELFAIMSMRFTCTEQGLLYIKIRIHYIIIYIHILENINYLLVSFVHYLKMTFGLIDKGKGG